MLLTAALLLLCPQSGDLAAALQDATALAERGQYGRAVAVLREAGAEDSQDSGALTALGTWLLRDAEARAAAGQLRGLAVNDAFLEAANLLRRATALPAAPPRAWENLSEALLNAGDPGHALEAVEEGLAAHPDELALLLQKGRVLAARAAQREGRPEKQTADRRAAAEVYRRAMEGHPGSATAAVRLGEMLVYLGDREGAVAAWREALARNPAEVDLAAVGQWLGNDSAADLLAERNGDDPASPLALWYQAWYEFYAEPRRWPQAKEHFQEALRRDPSFTSSWFFLGEGAMAEGTRLAQAGDQAAADREFALAVQAWAKYLEVAGEVQVQQLAAMEDGGEAFVQKIQWLVARAMRIGDGDSAGILARWVTRARPQDPVAWNNLGLVLRDTGHAEESLRAYQRALALRPDDPQLMNDLAVILHYYLRRDDEQARELYRKAAARAEAILQAGTELDEAERSRIQTALRDARNNLARLEAGDRRPG